MSVTLADKDGSESFIVKITGGVPSGARIYGAGGAEILPVAGVYTLSPADVSALAILPPVHYSSAGQGDIVLVTVTEVTDNSGASSIVSSFTNNITVEVLGVADAPETRNVNVTASEDEPIALGAAILASAAGDLDNLLVDTDGSEALSFVIGGLPQGIVPTTSNPGGGVIYIGNGTWSVTAAAMATLELPAVPNFSGVNPYSGVTVRAVTQELDGDDASSAQWPVTINVNPVINGGTVDGFASWGLGATQTEGSNESGGDISLASVANHTYVDNDGSESVVSYTFDLSSLIADAGIAAHLATLPGAGSGLDKLANTYISGTFSYDSGAGTITVLAANIASVALSGELFLDSNQDFSIPVSALVRDTAMIGGLPVSVDKTETGSFTVDLVGTADTPTAFASSVSGSSGSELALSLGGVSTDTDVSLGRALSEDVYYVVSVLNPGTAPALGFTDGAGNIVGLDNGDGTWVLTPADLVNLHVFTPGGAVGTANLRLTTIATENDGDVASNTANFNVVVTSGSGGGGTAPLPPDVAIGLNSGNEDGSITLNVTAVPAPGDTTNPSVAVMISNIPVGAEVIGARFNPDTGRWVASAAAVNAGLVQILPPHDFSGTMNITVEAVATNASLLKASTGATTVPVDVDPVADGVNISASPDAGVEDIAIDLNISLGLIDTDGSEVIGGYVYVQLGEGATLVGAYPTATTTEAAEGAIALGGTFYKVPVADLATLQALAAPNWHGSIPVTVKAVSIESADNDDGDKFALGTGTLSVSVTASADAPVIAAGNAAGDEDTAILIPGLSAALADTVTTNGAEVLSVKISGVPEGSRFSSGSNNGDGSWTIPVSALGTLSITPPLNYSGTMALTLTAIALELSNGSEAQSSVGFSVTVASKADTVEILAENASIDGTGTAQLDLNVRMSDDNGANPGENPPEVIEITFTSVPAGVSLLAVGGGSFTSPAAGTWIFTGTEAEANAIGAEASATASGGTYVVNLSAVTIDGLHTLATPVTDTFQLTIPNVVAGTPSGETLSGGSGIDLIYGLLGGDILLGGDGADLLAGGQGADTLTGGAGSDRFQIAAGDVGTGVDTISDFAVGVGGDAIDIAKVLSGFDPLASILDDFVRTSETAGNTTIEVDADGGGDNFTAVVVLQGVTGLDADTMRANGNLIV
jgi:hypothetical protein